MEPCSKPPAGHIMGLPSEMLGGQCSGAVCAQSSNRSRPATAVFSMGPRWGNSLRRYCCSSCMVPGFLQLSCSVMLSGVYLPACSLQDIDSPHLLCMCRFSLQLTNLTGHLMDHTIATQTRMLSLELLGSQTQVTDLFNCRMEMPEHSCSQEVGLPGE